MILDTARLKLSTKGLVSLVVLLAGLLQIPAVSAPVFALGKLHPHFASVIAALMGVATLLHNPQVEAFLGINQTQIATPEGTITETSVTVQQDK